MSFKEHLLDHYPVPQLREPALEVLSPTRALKDCYRGIVVESFGYREPLSPNSEINFSYGTLRHEFIQGILLDKGVIKQAEVPVFNDDPPLRGFVDGITDDRVLEIKTTNKPLKDITKPLYNHASQAMLYMHMTGLSKATLLYETKQYCTDPWKEIEVEYDEEWMQVIFKRCYKILDYLEKRQLPQPDHKCLRWCKNPACFDPEVHKACGIL